LKRDLTANCTTTQAAIMQNAVERHVYEIIKLLIYMNYFYFIGLARSLLRSR